MICVVRRFVGFARKLFLHPLNGAMIQGFRYSVDNNFPLGCLVVYRLLDISLRIVSPPAIHCSQSRMKRVLFKSMTVIPPAMSPKGKFVIDLNYLKQTYERSNTTQRKSIVEVVALFR